MLKNINKNKIIAIIIPLGIGLLSFLITRNGISYYANHLIKPSFAPPGFLFGIVWTVLYILMGISSFYIYESIDCHRSNCLILYGLNLLLNFCWPIIFFNLETRLFAFLFIILLDVVVVLMTLCFYGIDKKSGYLNIPYIIWLIFATILNLSVYILNR